MSDVTDAPQRAAASQQSTASAQGAHIWYEVMTSDPEGAKAFYEAVVPGWSIGDRIPGDTDYRMIGRSDGAFAGGLLGLDDKMREHGAQPIWMGYIGVDDVDATVARIEAEGGKTLMPAFDIPQGRIAMVADLQGASFYVMKPIPPEGDENKVSDVFSVDQAQHVRWNELSTSDPDAAIAFYSRHFGWGQDGDMDMGEMGKYRFIQHGSVMIGAVMPKMPQMPVSMWTYYIGVDDIDRAAEAINGNGGSILNGPMEIPGGEFALNAMDPQGASFGLVGPRKQ